MELEFRRILACMKNSDMIQDGEYYVIHADHIHDFYKAIEHYFEDSKLAEIDQNDTKWNYVYSQKSHKEIVENLNYLRLKYNAIINKLERMEK